MKFPECQTLLLDLNNQVLTVTMNRPEKRNAMNQQLVEEVIAVFDAIAVDLSVRMVVLRGAEGHFCAGADISGLNHPEMSETEATRATGAGNRIFGRMITQVNEAPQVVVCLLEGAVMGGGFGLACVSDVAITDKNAKFALPETGLGIIPAQIAPFVVTRIGLTQARRLALLGETLNGYQAQALGITHFVTESKDEMEKTLVDVISKVRRCAPQATAVTKKLMLQVGQTPLDSLLDSAADRFCEALRSEEGSEGTQAFLEKRLPSWAD